MPDDIEPQELKRRIDALDASAKEVKSTLEKTSVQSAESAGKLSVLVGGSAIGLLITVAGVALVLTYFTKFQEKLSEAMKEVERLQEKVRIAEKEAEEYRKGLQSPPPPPTLNNPSAPVTVSRGKLTCTTKESSSVFGRYPTASVELTPEERGEFVVTGGGCKTPRAGEGSPHNIPTIKSAPIPNGWSCAAGDPPNLPVDSQITAFLIACAVK